MSIEPDKLDRIMASMPPFPVSVNRILALTSDSNFVASELVSVIEHDPVITLKLLKIVNSAAFGLARQVCSVKESVVYLGANTIKHVAITVAAIGVMPKRSFSGIGHQNFLRHAINTAVAARALARFRGTSEDGTTVPFVGGLLHDIGIIAAGTLEPDAYVDVTKAARAGDRPLHDLERRRFGWDHAALGSRIAERWKLPKSLISCIRDHHAPPTDSDSEAVRCVFVANQLAKSGTHGGYSVVEPLSEPILDWLGMDLGALNARLVDLPKELERASVFLATAD